MHHADMWFSQKTPKPSEHRLGYLTVESTEPLLRPFQPVLQSIKAAVGLPESHWRDIYHPVLRSYAALVQHLPASEAHHHAEIGGLLRHGLETMLEALVLRRDRLLPPGAPAEEIARLQDLWTYAAATAALLHDVGKPITDLLVTYRERENGKRQMWQPLVATLPVGASYRFRFNPQRQYHRHALIPPLLAHRLVPAAGLDWLASEALVFDAWLAAISGDGGGPLSPIAHEADGISVARDLSGGLRTRSPAARAKPLSERLLTGLRQMVKEGAISLNRPGASGFVSAGRLWLVSKRVLDDLREHLTKEGQTGIPSRNDRLMDELQQWHVVLPNGDKAVWNCEIQIGTWRQSLTCLCIDVALVWPNTAEVPSDIEGEVIPAEAGQSPASRPPSGATGEAVYSVNSSQAENSAAIGGEENALAEATLPQCPVASALPVSEPVVTEALYGELPTPFPIPESPQKTRVPVSSEAAAGNTPPSLPSDDPGQRFVAWLVRNIEQGQVEINTVRARLHVLPEGLAMITPGIFRDFSPEQWERAQKRFQKLKLHAKTAAGTNIWTCQVAKDRKRSTVKVMLIPNPEEALGLSGLAQPNPAVTLLV